VWIFIVGVDVSRPYVSHLAFLSGIKVGPDGKQA